jgi:hypothetical protein
MAGPVLAMIGLRRRAINRCNVHPAMALDNLP